MPVFSSDYFAYGDLIRCCGDRFGPDSVLILPYELLRKEPEDFATRIARFVDLPEVPGISPSTQNAGLFAIAAGCKRRLNLPLERDRANPAGMIGDPRFNVPLDRLFDRFLPRGDRAAGERRLRSRVQEFVGSQYYESNQRTSDISGLDRGSLGYQMPSTYRGEN